MRKFFCEGGGTPSLTKKSFQQPNFFKKLLTGGKKQTPPQFRYNGSD